MSMTDKSWFSSKKVFIDLESWISDKTTDMADGQVGVIRVSIHDKNGNTLPDGIKEIEYHVGRVAARFEDIKE